MNQPTSCSILLVDSVKSMMMHGLANPKFKIHSVYFDNWNFNVMTAQKFTFDGSNCRVNAT
jgi:hypothetical protein